MSGRRASIHDCLVLCTLLAACPDPAAQTTEGDPQTTSATGSTGATDPTGTATATDPTTTVSASTSTSTSGDLTSSSDSSASWTSTSTVGVTDTSDTTDTTDTGTTTGDPGTSTTTTSTTGGPPSTCGPVCDETWEFFGDLQVTAAPADYTCMTRVHGELWISHDADPATVATLANVTRVDDALRVGGPESATDVAMLGCLREVQELYIHDLPQVTDLGPLAQLRVAPKIQLLDLGITALPQFAPDFEGVDTLYLYLNPALTDLSAASTWGAGQKSLAIVMTGNAALTDLAGLAGLIADSPQGWAAVQLIDHPALTSLAGLETLASGDVYLAELPQLADLTPLLQLKTGSVTLIDLPKITDLSGLANLETASTLMLGDCVNFGEGGMDGLTSLAGLDSLTSVGSFSLANNDALASLAGAPLLTSVQGLEVVNNPALTQAAHDAFVAQLDAPPPGCFGDWNTCECFVFNPW